MHHHHNVDIVEARDGRTVEFQPFCLTCGWVGHTFRNNRTDAVNDADEHILAMTRGEP